MKNRTLTLGIALMASAAMPAQTTLWNGEDNNNPFWTDNRCATEIVDNDKTDGINTSAKCFHFKTTGTDWNNGCIGVTLPDGLSFESKRLSLMIRTTFSSNVRVELECTDPDDDTKTIAKKTAAWQEGNGEWKKLYFDFSTNGDFGTLKNLIIYPSTDNTAVGNDVFIDNIQTEDAPKASGTLLSTVADGSLTGAVTLSGAWLKGECQNVDGDWVKVEYNDFATLASKLADGITSIDLRGTTTKDADVNALRGERANVLVFADEAYDADNVVADGACARLVLASTSAFAAPEGFTAASVAMARPVYAGNNSLCLPFSVTAEELGASVAVFKEITSTDNATTVHFTKGTSVDANTPFIAQFEADKESLAFTEKEVVATPKELGTTFTGVYAPSSAAGKYGLNGEGKFQKGGESATINAFSAYLTLPETQSAAALLVIDDDATGINAYTAAKESAAVYTLQGIRVKQPRANGIYIVGGKKMIVK